MLFKKTKLTIPKSIVLVLLKHTYTSTSLDNHHPSKHRSHSPSPLMTLQTNTYLPYHIPSRPIHKAHTDTTHQASFAPAPQASHTHHQHKLAFTHLANNNNGMTKTTPRNVTQPPQHPHHTHKHTHTS